MIRITKDVSHCVGCGNCRWWFEETKKYWIDNKIEIADHQWNGKTQEMVDRLESRCYLELIKVEQIEAER